MPVTYADVWEFWLRYRELASAVDFVTIHILPYWEDDPVAARDAADHVDCDPQARGRQFPGKEIVIGEVGWPSAGRMREGALPSPANQARVHRRRAGARQARELPRQRDRGVRPAVEARAGRHRRRPLGVVRRRDAPRRNSPGACRCRTIRIGRGRPRAASRWRRWCSARRSVARAAKCRPRTDVGVWSAIAFECGRRRRAGRLDRRERAGREPRHRRLAARRLRSPRLRSLRRSSALRRWPRRWRAPAFASVLGPRPDRVRDPLALALGLLLIALTVLAVQSALALSFDPRYRDFPFAPLTAAAVPFAAADVSSRRGQRSARAWRKRSRLRCWRCARSSSSGTRRSPTGRRCGSPRRSVLAGVQLASGTGRARLRISSATASADSAAL